MITFDIINMNLKRTYVIINILTFLKKIKPFKQQMFEGKQAAYTMRHAIEEVEMVDTAENFKKSGANEQSN